MHESVLKDSSHMPCLFFSFPTDSFTTIMQPMLGTPEDRDNCCLASRLMPLSTVHGIITHKNCPDGIAAAFLLDKPTIFVDPGVEVSEKVLGRVAGKNVLMIDIAPATDVDFEKYNSAASKFLVLDHHVSNTSKYNARPNFIACDELSGVSAAYYYSQKEFTQQALQVVHHVHQRDLWSWSGTPEEIRESKAFSLALSTALRGITSESGVKFIKQVCHDHDMYDCIMAQGVIALADLDNKTSEIKTLVTRGRLHDIDVAAIDMTERSHLRIAINEAGNKIAEELGCIVMFITHTSNVYCSLRGNNCLELALKFNGGGHANAAGFSMSPEAYTELIVPFIF